MRRRIVLAAALLALVLRLVAPAGLRAQAPAAAPPFPTWRPVAVAPAAPVHALRPVAAGVAERPAGRSHPWTGLLVGGLVGAAVTTVFLAGYCSDPDTSCGADEVGRATLVFAVPAALVGTLVGALIRTGD